MMDYRLYLVTGNYGYDESIFLKKVEQACQAGVTLVQLREKIGTTKEIYERAIKVKKITDNYRIPLIINDRVDICLATDAAGVHIGDEELPIRVVRKLIGDKKILGVSAKTVLRATKAENEGANYLGVGAIFPTKTKNTPLTKLETLQEIKQQVTIPVVAIGGLNETNLSNFEQVSVDGFALVSEIMQAEDPIQKVRRLRRKIEAMRKERESK